MGRCVWLCDFSLLFFCVLFTGLLVCAEGYTQVTGVVAMMMTGRVLLVCALCVLWCGAVFGHAMDDYCDGGGGNVLRHTSNGGNDGVSLKTDGRLLSTRMGLIKGVEASEGELGVDDPNPLDKGNSLDESKGDGVAGSGGGGVAGPPAAAALVPPNPGGPDTGEQGKTVVVDTEGARHTEDTKNESGTNPKKSKIDDSSSSPPGSPTTKGVKEPALKSNFGGSQPSEDKEKEEEEDEDRRSKSDSREAVVEEETKELK
ncbi:mucin-associated surface protein (MASP), putative, partial [Trypanosoma cruzi marinkellei]